MNLRFFIRLCTATDDVMDTNMAVPGSSASAPVHPARPYTHAELLATVPVPQQVASTAVPQLCALGRYGDLHLEKFYPDKQART